MSRVEKPVAEEDPRIEQPGVEDEILTAAAGADRRGSVEDVEMAERADGDGTQYDVVVRVTSREAADETLLEAMEDHEHIYRAVHTSGAADRIGDVAVVSRVDGPNMTLDTAYETTLDRETTREIDWRSAADVQNLPEYWEEMICRQRAKGATVRAFRNRSDDGGARPSRRTPSSHTGSTLARTHCPVRRALASRPGGC